MCVVNVLLLNFVVLLHIDKARKMRLSMEEMKMKKIVLVLILVLAAISSMASAMVANDWVLDRDFSKTANPNGDWTYGVYLEDGHPAGDFYTWPAYYDWTTDGTIGYYGNPGQDLGAGCVFYTNSDTAFAFGTQWWVPGKVMLHPGAVGYAYAPVIRWTAPSDMVVSVDALFYGCEDGTTTDVHVLLNGTMYNGTEATGWIPTYTNSLMDGILDGNYGYAPLEIAPSGTSNNVSYNAVLSLQAGDMLDFVASYGPDISLAADLTGIDVTITLIPEPATMALLSMGGLALLRKRK